MVGYKVLSTAVILSLFFTGCTHTVMEKRVHSSAAAGKQPFKTATLPPALQCPKNDRTKLYGMAAGESEKDAVKQAVLHLKRRVWSEFVAEMDRQYEGDRRVFRYLPKEQIKRAKRVLERIPFSVFTVLTSHRLENGKTEAVVTVERKKMAAPLKKAVMARLVAIEERWHTSRGESLLERYLLAGDSLKKMQRLLPEYLLADYISPFSTPIASRVENSLPYFDKTAGRLKKRLRFCIEPVTTPAMKLFAEAVARVLKKERLISTGPTGSDSRTLCISIEGDLTHKKRAQEHIFEATLQLTLHKRYKAPIATERYRVRGVSRQSGTKALEKAAEALQKELEKHFLQTV